jgi:AcrR family transcriptional regulator
MDASAALSMAADRSCRAILAAEAHLKISENPDYLDPRAVRSRDGLRRALLALLERHSFEQITIRDITNEAGLGYSTFFRQYETREALLGELASDQIRELVALASPALAAADTRAACLNICGYVNDHRALWAALLTGGAAATVRNGLMANWVTTAEAYPAPESWLTAELGAICAVGTMIEILTWWLRQTKPMPVEWVAEALDRIAMQPIKR